MRPQDVARAFDKIVHKGQLGHIYNIGGHNEISNVEVAKTLIKIMGLEDRMETLITYVPDRAFNDLRYTINSSRLEALGWKEEMPWEEGLKRTVEWYQKYSSRYGNIDAALVAHPRRGSTISGSAEGGEGAQIL